MPFIFPGDWPEDFALKNGRDTYPCAKCKRVFTGHKNRVVCRKCHEEACRTGDVALFEMLGGSPDNQ